VLDCGSVVLLWGSVVLDCGTVVLLWGSVVLDCGTVVLDWGTVVLLWGSVVLDCGELPGCDIWAPASTAGMHITRIAARSPAPVRMARVYTFTPCHVCNQFRSLLIGEHPIVSF